MFSLVRKLREQRRGTTTVELALVLPILLMIYFSLIEFGHCYMTSQLLKTAARKAARFGVADGKTTAQVKAEVQNMIKSAMDPSKATIYVKDGSMFEVDGASPPRVIRRCRTWRSAAWTRASCSWCGSRCPTTRSVCFRAGSGTRTCTTSRSAGSRSCGTSDAVRGKSGAGVSRKRHDDEHTTIQLEKRRKIATRDGGGRTGDRTALPVRAAVRRDRDRTRVGSRAFVDDGGAGRRSVWGDGQARICGGGGEFARQDRLRTFEISWWPRAFRPGR